MKMEIKLNIGVEFVGIIIVLKIIEKNGFLKIKIAVIKKN